MRVLLVNSYYYPEILGGAEVSVQKLAEGLTATGVLCDVLCTAASDADDVMSGVSVHRRRMRVVKRSNEDLPLGLPRKLRSRAERLYNAKNVGILEAVVDAVRPEVIHTNGLYDISPVVWRVAKARGIPLVHTLRDYALVCPRSTLVTRANARCEHPHVLCRAYARANLLMSTWVDAVTAPSEVTLRAVCERGLFPRAITRVVPNAIEVDTGLSFGEVSRRRPDPSPEHPLTFVFLGTLSEKKGVLWLFEAFERLPLAARLLIAGQGELQDLVRRRAEEDERIRYLGFLDEDEVRDVLAGCHVLVCPSLWDEPFGRVVLDAYRAGMPVVASRMGALEALVRDERTGLLVEAGDVRGLAEALGRYAANPALIRLHGRHAFEELAHYTVSEQVRTFSELYQRVMKGGVGA